MRGCARGEGDIGSFGSSLEFFSLVACEKFFQSPSTLSSATSNPYVSAASQSALPLIPFLIYHAVWRSLIAFFNLDADQFRGYVFVPAEQGEYEHLPQRPRRLLLNTRLSDHNVDEEAASNSPHCKHFLLALLRQYDRSNS